MSGDGQQVERQRLDVDIACVGFGPAVGGFLTTLTSGLADERAGHVESTVAPGMPPQIICYERADDVGFGVSGVVTRARGIRATFPNLDPAQIPMATPVSGEKVLYLLDPIGASRRSRTLRLADRLLRPFVRKGTYAFELPYTPPFLRKHDGLVLSIGQFNQWVATQVMGSGLAQVWPSMPVAEPLIENDAVAGIRLVDQGTDRSGNPDAGYMPGMDVHAQLTVIGDGPVGPVSRAIDEHFGRPEGHHLREWALGMKAVVELPEDCPLPEGTVLHTLGYPEPEIFGFLYVHPNRLASAGIFVPSWMGNPLRTAYRYLQHYMQHPYLWQFLKGGTLRSWGAKSLQESGRHGEPFLAGNGYARIGECSGSTNVLTGSGVDEAWTTGALLAEGVLELMRAGKPFTRENLEQVYVRRRRESWLEEESQTAADARNGFQKGFVRGLVGMAMAGMTRGLFAFRHQIPPPHRQIANIVGYYTEKQIAVARESAAASNIPLHDALMNARGWPQIEFDGQLLISHQDALLMGGKVQATPGFADHVQFADVQLCLRCGERTCISMCSGQAITQGEPGEPPAFDREKCVYCGACLWNCAQSTDGERGNVRFNAGSGGLHSAEN